MNAIFWIAVAWLVYVYLGYPLVLWVMGWFQQVRHHAEPAVRPPVSVLISARNEEKDIAWKIKQTLEWNYPAGQLEILVASDASEDRTDDILASIFDPRLRYVRNTQRIGKNASLNTLAGLARGEVLFFTDANSHIPADCLRKMVAHFADPTVGCVTGWERAEREARSSAMTVGGGSYLTYESVISWLESQLGSVLVCDGSVFCIRKELFTELQPELTNDLELPLHIGAKGYRLLYEPAAVSTEKNTASPREDFSRRRRICAQGVLAFWRFRKKIRGFRAWQFLSRKLLRWFSLVPMVLLLGASALLAQQPVFRILLLLQVAFYSAAIVGWYVAARTDIQNRLLALPFYFILVNLGAVAGFFDACRGRRFSVWEIPSLSRGRELP